ncbi:MAG: branched-chain amino acid transaminase [Planctomycetota bacterium]|nr:MAG: branched-chain amino acid transaminase [Planctomycetota bacterium]
MASADPSTIAYLRDSYRPLAECQVPINLHAFQYGTGCFEGIRGYWDGERINVLFMREHFERLAGNARLLHMHSPSVEDMCEIAQELVRQNRCQQNIYFRPMVFKDGLELGPVLHRMDDGYLCYIIPLGDYLDTSKGLDLCVSSWTRLSDNTIPTRAKATGGYLNSALAKSEALMNGYDEALMLNSRGQVAEGSAENLFLVRDGALVTPDLASDILEGITRFAVIELANLLGIPVVERPVGRTELYRTDEAFLCGTGCQVSWVRSIDRRVVSDTRGPITERIQKLYEDAVYGRDPRFAHWLTPVPVS